MLGDGGKFQKPPSHQLEGGAFAISGRDVSARPPLRPLAYVLWTLNFSWRSAMVCRST